MRKNKLGSLTTLVLLLTMVALILVSGTYAKYTTERSTADTAVVAKFVVDAKVNGNAMSSFKLFDTVTEADGTTAEAEVAADRIAPGTGGKFDIVLSNGSEVKVNYSLKFTETNNSNVPIEYSTDGTTWKTAADFEKTGSFAVDDTTDQTVTVQWRWAYENGLTTDVQDTNLGTAATAPEVTVTAKVTFTQAD